MAIFTQQARSTHRLCSGSNPEHRSERCSELVEELDEGLVEGFDSPRPTEERWTRSGTNIVFLSFCVPDEMWTFWPCVRTVESITSQRAVWSHWRKFLEDPDSYLTWKYSVGNRKGAAFTQASEQCVGDFAYSYCAD